MSQNRQLNLSISAVTDRLVFGKGDTSSTQKGFITNKRGQKLFTRFWYPPSGAEPVGLAFISHGFSEHLGNYHTVGEALAEANILAFGHDHVGHGQSEGIPAYIESVDEYVDDLIQHCQAVKNRYDPSIPLFVVAHSMGGMVALRAALCYPKMFRGMVLQGPLIIPGAQFGPIDFRVTSLRAFPVRLVLGALNLFHPEMILGGVNMDLISGDEEVKRALASDGLRWSSGCKVRLLLAFVTCLENNLNMMSGLKVPFLALHGTADGLCNVQGSRLLKNCSFVDDKEIKEYEGSAHNLYMELPEVRQCAIEQTVRWVKDRC